MWGAKLLRQHVTFVRCAYLVTLCLGASFSFALASSTAAAGDSASADPGITPHIVNGVSTTDYETTGALLVGGNPGSASVDCSGTLIGCETFLTAAHCVCNGIGSDCQPPSDPDPSSALVYLQHAGFFTIDSIIVHPDYAFPFADLAVVKLGAPVDGIAPTPISTTLAAIPSPGTIVGFGRTGGNSSNSDYGVKRVGTITSTNCNEYSDTNLICWTFTGAGSNTCNADSGGPMFMDFGSGDVLAGVTSGGNASNCLPNDHSFDVNVATFSPWIQSVSGADISNTSCGPGAQVGEPDVAVSSAGGTLDSVVTSELHEFVVVDGSRQLRFALNGHDDGVADFDLYVKRGSEPTISDFDCSQTGSGQLGYCAFDSPGGGRWYALVNREDGAGEYQVTVTDMDTVPATCGNGLIEPGEQCDGTDDLACSGLCQGDCNCPPPVCGNDVRESGEQCDGTDAAECTGPCTLSCACPCLSGDMEVRRLVTSATKLLIKARIDATGGEYGGLDPRSGFTAVVEDLPIVAGLDLSAGLEGWEKSRPDKGRYKWRGDGSLNGFINVKINDKIVKKGRLDIVVKGKFVPNVEFVNPDTAGVELTLDGVCTVNGCGDSIVDPEKGEECDDGIPTASCDSDCSFPVCGDGTQNIFAGEDCDDGDLTDGDGCDSNCTVTGCGNGIATAGEDCDDSGESATCDADCTAAMCGDGTTNASAGETCDDSGESATCDADCTAATCGDGTTNASAGETCDDSGESAICDMDCTAVTCGDGTVNTTAGEECDPPDGGVTCDLSCLSVP
jgi:cysteine-rich repeat protein